MINGHRLNDDFSGAALTFNRYLETGNVEQVEVVRGPGSALYGSNAFLGVVNIVTSTDRNDATTSAGEHGYRAGHVNIASAGRGTRTSFFLGGFTDDGGRFADTSSPTPAATQDPRESIQAYATVESDRLRLEARYSRIDIENFWLFGTAPSSALNDYESKDYSADLSYAFFDNDRARLTASAGYRKIHNDSRVLILPAETMLSLSEAGLTDGSDPFIRGPTVELSQMQCRVDGRYGAGDAHTLTGGLEYRRTEFDKLKNRNNYETLDIIDVLFLRIPGTIRFYGDLLETADFGPTGFHRAIWGVNCRTSTDSARGRVQPLVCGSTTIPTSAAT